MQALIYTRVSQDRAEGRSPAEQKKEAEAFCQRKGWEVVDVITDSVGASRHSKGERTGWEDVKRRIEGGTVDVLVTWEASRAQRDLAAYAELRDLCVSAGVLWSYSGKTHDLSNVDDRFKTGLDALLAEREVDQTVERVNRAMRANAEAGRPHGRLLDGYRRIYDDTTGAFVAQVPDGERAPVIRRIFDLYLSGHGIRPITRILNGEGVPTSTGKEWNDAQVRAVLVRPAYAGKRVHKGQVVGQGDWPALVSDEDFERVQARLKASSTGARRTTSKGRLLSAVSRCGKCGGKMHVLHDRNKRKVYTCREGYCVSRDQTKLDDFVSGVVVHYLSDPATARALGEDQPLPEVEEAAAELENLRSRLAGATTAYANGSIEIGTLAAVEADVMPRIREVEAAIRDAYLPVKVDVPAEGVGEWWESLPLDQRRVLVGALVSSVEVLPTGRGTRTFNPDHVRINWR